MSAHTREYEQATIDGADWHDGPVEAQVTITTFSDDYRPSFDIQVKVEGEWVLITEDESLDNPPDPDELRDLVKDWFDSCTHQDMRIVDQVGVPFRCTRCGEGVR